MTGFLLLLSLTGNVLALYYYLTRGEGQQRRGQRVEAERLILRQAMYARGVVSAVEIAARSALPLSVVETALRDMVADNQCQSELDAEGRVIYIFPHFDDSALRREALEREILRLAATYGGELSVEQVAMNTDLTLAQARQWLTEMAERGACRELGADHGRFHFAGLVRRDG